MAENLSGSEDEIERNVSSTFDFTKKTWKDDIAFLVEGKQLYAAKSILALVSPVFESMFGTQFAEKYQNEVGLPGKKFEDFHEFLMCAYPTSGRPVDEKNVTKLLPLADEYQAKSLMKRCDKFLCSYLLSKEDLSTTYLMNCHEMSTRYHLQNVKDMCVLILAEREQKELNEAKRVLQDPDSFLQVQSDIISKQGSDRAKMRTELVKLYLNIDTSRNTFTGDIIGFEFAKGAFIEFKPSLTALVKKQPQFSVPVRLWDLSFQLQLTHVLKPDGEQCMYLKLNCTFPDDGLAWVCETKGKICIKNQHIMPSVVNTCLWLKGSFINRERTYSFSVQNLAPILKKDSGYIKEDQFDISLHFLANKPYIEHTNPSHGS